MKKSIKILELCVSKNAQQEKKQENLKSKYYAVKPFIIFIEKMTLRKFQFVLYDKPLFVTVDLGEMGVSIYLMQPFVECITAIGCER